MVGEIRDSETAQIAVQSALIGHLVFTTVHADLLSDNDLLVVDDVSMTNSDALNEYVSMNLRMTVYLREGA